MWIFLSGFPWEILNILRHQGFVGSFGLTARRTSKEKAHKVAASTHLHSPFLLPSLPACSLQEGNVLSPALNTLWVTPVLFCSYPVFVNPHFQSWITSIILLTSLPQHFNDSLSFWGTYCVSPTPWRITSPRYGSLPLLAASELSEC